MAWETKSHPLEYPVEMGEGEEKRLIETVTMKMPGGRKLREIEKLLPAADEYVLDGDGNVQKDDEGNVIIAPPTLDATMDMIQIMSDMPANGIDELHPRDITKLGEIMGPFLETAMGGGGSSGNSPDGMVKTKVK